MALWRFEIHQRFAFLAQSPGRKHVNRKDVYGKKDGDEIAT